VEWTKEERMSERADRRSAGARRKVLRGLDQIAAEVHAKDMTPRLRLELAGIEPKDVTAVLEVCELFDGTISPVRSAKSGRHTV
jgi:hypothetical protein